MQDGTKREAVSWKLSAAFFHWVLVILNVFLCNMLLKNACKILKIYDFQLLVLTPSCVSFWRCFGSPNGGQGHQTATSKKHEKWCPIWPQTGPKGGPKMEPKSSKMKSWKHLVSRVAPKWPPGSILERFWDHVGSMFVNFLRYVLWFLHAFCSSMLQTNTFKITRNHQKNAAASFQETTSLFVPPCIEKFTGEC